MIEQERKALRDELGYDPLWYMEDQGDLRQFFNCVNRDSVERVSKAMEEFEENHMSQK